MPRGLLAICVLCIGCSAAIDADEDGFASEQDCDDSDPAVFPGSEETCTSGCAGGGITVCQPDGTMSECQCPPDCGNGVLNDGEECDGAAVALDSLCTDAGYRGTPTCRLCRIDYSTCTGVCVGDGSDEDVTLTDMSPFTRAGVDAITGAALEISDAIGNFTAGDEVIVLQVVADASVDPEAIGRYELARIASVTATTVTLTAPLAFAFVTAPPARVTVQKVPNFANVMIASTVDVAAWSFDQGRGGLLFFRANGAVTFTSGGIDASRRGFREGNGEQATGQNGTPPPDSSARHPGGGGGHAIAGETRDAVAPGGAARGEPGIAPHLTFGGGGGRSAQGGGDYCVGPEAGGGAIVIVATAVSGPGSLQANGANAAPEGNCGPSEPTGTGSSAGGTVAIAARTAISDLTIRANSGVPVPLGTPAMEGGRGSVGRVALYCEDCTPSPASAAPEPMPMNIAAGSLARCAPR